MLSVAPAHPIRRCALIFSCCVVASCESYRSSPLGFDEILDEIARSNHVSPDAEQRFDFGAATRRLLEHGPSLQEARSALAEATAIAEAGAPFANPTIEAGPLFLDGPGLTSSLRRGIEAAVGWAIPLGDQLETVEDVDDARRAARATELTAQLHRSYLDLRAAWVEASFAERDAALATARAALARRIEERTRTLADSGRSSGFELRTAEIDRITSERAALGARRAVIATRAKLASLCGTSIESLGRLDIETLPRLVDAGGLQLDPRLLRDHPALRELAAQHAIREQELRLEVARQYPSLSLSPNYEREGKTDRWGLGIGIELPIFDRNQRGIAAARAARKSSRARFITHTRSLMLEIEQHRADLELARSEIDACVASLDASSRLRELARRGVESGRLPPWRYLEIERRHALATRDELHARRAVYRRHIALERSTGRPWLDFGAVTDAAGGILEPAILEPAMPKDSTTKKHENEVRSR